jgi:Ca-activated chloride channel family protein
MTFRFLHPWLLLLLIPTIILVIVQYFRRPPALLVSSVDHFSGTKGTVKPKMGILVLPLFLEAIGLLCFIIATARPQSGKEVILDVSNGIDIALCLDVSGSMQYFDPEKSQSRTAIAEKINNGTLKPRIEIAKKELKRFIEKRPTDRLGLVVFATQPYQLCPLTIDKKLLVKRVETVSTDMLGDFNNGTGIAAPLTTAVQRLKNSPAKRRVIILFTDGAHNQHQQLTPLQAAEIAKEFNITIYTVGIGGPSALRIRSNFLFNRSTLEAAPYQFDEVLMKKLAEETGGQYFHVKNEESFKVVMDSIDELEKVEIKRPKYVNFKDLFPWFLYCGAFLVGTSFFLSKSVFMRMP